MSEAFELAAETIARLDVAALSTALAAQPDLVRARDGESGTLLWLAACQLVSGDWSRPPHPPDDPDGGRLHLIETLLDAGADIAATHDDGWTALHEAAYANHVPAVRLLLARDAPLETSAAGDGGTPLVLALFWGHREATAALLEAGATILNLRAAAGVGDLAAVERFFDTGGRLVPTAGAHCDFYRPHDGFPEWTRTGSAQETLDDALSYACRSGRVNVLPTLVDHGADVNAAPWIGSPLHWATNFGHVDTMAWLLDIGADIHSTAGMPGQAGATPLHTAAWAERLAPVELLIARGADRALRDTEHGGTPLDYARHRGATDVARYLESLA